ncbi:hypothetical protein [Allosphingosinicella sp.]|uniref:hypothetical protein n=1 Tax=Allosphingosinicella sp. TaxID=2823234 RepID=UPI0037840607
MKLDKITYEENFLVIELGEEVVSTGELDKEFSDVEQQVLRQFPGIPDDWMTALEEATGPHDMTLWERS